MKKKEKKKKLNCVFLFRAMIVFLKICSFLTFSVLSRLYSNTFIRENILTRVQSFRAVPMFTASIAFIVFFFNTEMNIFVAKSTFYGDVNFFHTFYVFVQKNFTF